MESVIFGGNGFIGKHLKEHLRDIGRDPVALDITLNPGEDESQRLVDVRDPIDADIVTDPGGTIYNLAAVHTTPGHPPEEYFDTNIAGALNVTAYARSRGIRKIVFTSSISVYGASEETKSETSGLRPNSEYGSSKAIAEWIHRSWLAEDPGRSLTILRPAVVFGYGEGGNFSRLYKALKDKRFVYPGRRDTKKACVYVKDLVRAMASMDGQMDGLQILNMCYRDAPTITEICETIADVTHVNAPKFSIPGRVLRSAAVMAYGAGRIVGKSLESVHPARIDKLMTSTDISGAKLANTPYAPNSSLREAIEDWFDDCNRKRLV